MCSSDLIINLSIDTSALFNFENGIFIPGRNFDSINPEWTGNYHMKGKSWERKTKLTYLDENLNLLINDTLDLRIHGLRTPIAPQKSLRIYSRKHPIKNYFFKERSYQEISRFILRSPFSAWGNSLLNDIIVTEIAKPLNIETMHFQPSLVYINGEYWGLYNLRERIDEYYIASLFKLKRDSIHIIDGRYKVKKGSLDEWNPLWKIVESDTMMHDTTYAKVRELLDIESFIDYNIAEIFFSNFDWPGNNMVSWKPTNKGKWRYLFYDLDATLQNYKRDNMKIGRAHV